MQLYPSKVSTIFPPNDPPFEEWLKEKLKEEESKWKEKTPKKASERQAGGSHYKDFAIQPAEYCEKNGLGFCEGNVVKYVSRHKMKNGAADIKKAIHMLELILEWQYNTTYKGEEV